MTGRRESPNLRQTVIRAAEAANVPLVDYDRALVLGQVADSSVHIRRSAERSPSRVARSCISLTAAHDCRATSTA